MTGQVTPLIPPIVLVRYGAPATRSSSRRRWRGVAKNRRLVRVALVVLSFGAGIILTVFAGEFAARPGPPIPHKAVVARPAAETVSGQLPAEMEQLRTRNRRLEALVAVLRARDDHRQGKAATTDRSPAVSVER